MIRLALTTHLATAVIAAAVVIGGCGGDDDGDAGSAASKGVSGRVSIIAVWSGDEQKSFQAVLDGFTGKFPDVTVKYTSGGDNVPTILATAVQGGRPPDIAGVAQPGLVKDLQKKGALKPIEFARSTIADNFPEDIVKLGEIDGDLYSLLFKAANKSTVWFNVGAFEKAGVSPPETWDDLLEVAETLEGCAASRPTRSPVRTAGR